MRLAADAQLPPLRLCAAGYLDAADRPYLERIQARLAAAGLGDRFRYVGEVDRAEKAAFLRSLDVMIAPSLWPESKGLPVLEAWECGVPVVVPALGALGELVADTGAGVTYEPGNQDELAARLKTLILDPPHAAELGRRGHEAVCTRYHVDRMARDTLALYQSILEGEGALAHR